MQINGPNLANSLRLVHPPPTLPAGGSGVENASAVNASTESAPTRPSSQSGNVGGLSFEAVYQKQLPRLEQTEAQKRVEQIRDAFVAGRTQVPIHFETPGGSRYQAGPNPYANAYMKLTPAPADVDGRATQAAAEQHQPRT